VRRNPRERRDWTNGRSTNPHTKTVARSRLGWPRSAVGARESRAEGTGGRRSPRVGARPKLS
jgi:hypothetical protein